jgi:hypothetical protein
MRAGTLQECTKLLARQAGITGYTAHHEGADGIVPRNSDDPCAIAHDDVRTLAHDSEPGFLERARRPDD